MASILKHSFPYLIIHLLFEEISRAYLIPLLSRQIQFDGGSTTCFTPDHDRHLSSNFNHTSFNRGNFSFLTDVVEEKEDHSAHLFFWGAWLRAGEGIRWLVAGTMPNSLYRMPLVYLSLTCVFCYSCSFLFVVCVFVFFFALIGAW